MAEKPVASANFSRMCAATYPDLQIVYAIGGECDLAERRLTYLALISPASQPDLYERKGSGFLDGYHAERARRSVGPTFGWRGLWTAFRAAKKVGRFQPS